MLLSRNEIRARAVAFARNWSGVTRERAEAQTFWNEFFHVFGITRRKVATFEEPVKNTSGDTEFIDLFWKGVVIAEHKSRGKDLAKAHTQASDYIQNLINERRGDDAPRYILVSDFARIALHDLEADKPENQTLEFDLADLPRHIRAFGFIAGYETRRVDPEDPANFNAVALLGRLHDELEAAGYAGHELERLLVRILFCLFADDTGIFGDPDVFRFFIERHTREDGSDVGAQLARFFGVLDTPRDKRQKNLDEDLADLPYVNGGLFSERLEFADFNSDMRSALVACCGFHWDRISPHIFGALFQSVMEPRERRQIGAHYTSERDILKLIRSLFLDDLVARFEKHRHNRAELRKLHDHIAGLKFLDPACGCGNFLILAYRELRRLEIAILRALYGEEIAEGDLRAECRVDVDQMHGIEIEEWPARIAEVAMWLMDHQMNQEVFNAFGKPLLRLPLTKSAKIVVGNALRLDWNEVLPAKECSYVMGNPPFVGAKEKNAEQRADLESVWSDVKGSGVLDYVTCWYRLASRYVGDTPVRCAFVSTNSVTQGEQVAPLWSTLFREGITINFAHRTFVWTSEARGRAHVHVVIIGFSRAVCDATKRIYEDDGTGTSILTTVSNINPYLVAGSNITIATRSKRLVGCAPFMEKGSEATDDGHLTLDAKEREELLAVDPRLDPYVRTFAGGRELLNGFDRWCLWLVDAPPNLIRESRIVRDRVEQVRQFREQSTKERTRNLARTPAVFGEIRQPSSRYLMIPKVSSERRHYLPMAFVEPVVIANGSALAVSNATLFDFGVLSSAMHMAWMRQICGRMKSDYQYSVSVVYNNFPWPQDVSDKHRQRVELAAQAVLDARALFPQSTLADLYDPVAMPPQLSKAHAELDRAVDLCYRPQKFDTERQRVEYLFALYEKLTAPLAAIAKPKRRAKKVKE